MKQLLFALAMVGSGSCQVNVASPTSQCNNFSDLRLLDLESGSAVSYVRGGCGAVNSLLEMSSCSAFACSKPTNFGTGGSKRNIVSFDVARTKNNYAAAYTAHESNPSTSTLTGSINIQMASKRWVSTMLSYIPGKVSLSVNSKSDNYIAVWEHASNNVSSLFIYENGTAAQQPIISSTSNLKKPKVISFKDEFLLFVLEGKDVAMRVISSTTGLPLSEFKTVYTTKSSLADYEVLSLNGM